MQLAVRNEKCFTTVLTITQRGSQKIEARRLRDSFPTTEFAISFFQESHTPFPGLLHEVLNG